MPWGDNLRRLFGVHDLTNAEAAALLGFSAAAVSEWVSKTRKEPRQPNLTTLLHVAEFFHISGDRLVLADFSDLLANELADAERFREVEARIHHMRTGLQAVPAKGKPVTVGTLSDLTSRSTTVARGKSRARTKSTDKATGGGNG